MDKQAPGFIQDQRKWCLDRTLEHFERTKRKPSAQTLIAFAAVLENYIISPVKE